MPVSVISIFFFFNDTATTEIYTLSLHDALPIWLNGKKVLSADPLPPWGQMPWLHYMQKNITGEVKSGKNLLGIAVRSEEHTSELQSRLHLVCRLLLEKKKTNTIVPLRTSDPASK